MENNSLVNNEINLFVIENYKTYESDMDVYSFNTKDFDSKKFKRRLNKELKEDKSLHYKYEDKFDCLAYGDIDHCETEEKVITILNYICFMYEIGFNDLSYTFCNKTENDYGTHWTIPKIQTNIKSLKIQMKEVGNKFNTNIKYVDSSVYGITGWLRLPYQTNKKKPIFHEIRQGQPIDFLLHYIENTEFTSYREEEVYIPSEIKHICIPNFKLLDALSDEFHSGFENWRNMAFYMKNLNYEYNDFLNYSRGSTFVSEKECLKLWNSSRLSNTITEGVLYSRLKITKPDVFASFNFKKIFVKTIFVDESKIININQRYLISLDNQNLDDINDVLTSNINNFFNSENKTLSIKSPYDTGKTKLLEKIFIKYQPKKILWISYRKTLTNDILGSFAEKFDFKDYQNKEYTADKLIIQLESLLKLKPNFMFIGDEYDIPSYDLIIIDEIESILSHFDSPTFKGKSRDVFNWMSEIIKVSKKMIVLDGDIGDRTYNFINHFGTSINISNNIKINKRNFIIKTDTDDFYKNILNDISNNKKIVIVSMSSKKCSDMEELIKKEYPKKKILIYTGKTDDSNKIDLKDVNENWTKCDVLIYSPTIESGVNFDIEYFDKIYGIICLQSTSQRAFCQMLSRVRKIKDININILNVNIQLKVNKLDKSNEYSYEEVKEVLTNLDVFQMKEIIELGKIKKELELYDSNYIFNKIENLYKVDYYFLSYLKFLVELKGHSFKVIESEKKTKIISEEDLEEDKVDELLLVKDISKIEYENLLHKQSESQATTEDKLKIKKYIFKKCLGVDILNQELIDNYDFSTIKNYVNLIDTKNIIKSTDNKYKETVLKVEFIQKLINEIGFINMYDRKTKIETNELISRIEQLNIFNDDKALRILFNCRSIKNKFDSIKSFLGCVNSILETYSLKIQSNRYKENQKELYNYMLINSKGREHIDELLQYKINNGLVIERNIRKYIPTIYYKDLIKIKSLVIEDDEDEKVIFLYKDHQTDSWRDKSHK